MNLKFFRTPEEEELSVLIQEDANDNDIDFDYIKLVDSLYKDHDSISIIYDDSVTEQERGKINNLFEDIKSALSDD